jgi:hypothetical protein
MEKMDKENTEMGINQKQGKKHREATLKYMILN